MILEVNAEEIRDVAAAINTARKREPGLQILADIEHLVLAAIRARQSSLELETEQAQALRNVLLMRAHDQRNTTEGVDYADLAERISRDLDTEAPEIEIIQNRDA